MSHKKIFIPMSRVQRLAAWLDERLGTNGRKVKQEFVAMLGEYVGTTMFLFMAFGAANIANLPGATPTDLIDTSNLMFIALAFGLSLIVNVWIFFRVSGGLFNPAVTLALALAQVIPPGRAVLLSVSQVLGGITAAALIQCLIPGPLRVSTRLGGGISTSQGLFLEMFVTALLILMIFMLAVEKTKATFVAPVGIGLTLFVGHLVAVYWTGAGLNPARSFGPEVVIGNFPGYHWIYCINRRGKRLILGVGPSLGAIVSTGFYMILKVLNYDDVDEAADRDDTPLREAAKRAAREDLQIHAEPGSLTEEHAAASEAMAENV